MDDVTGEYLTFSFSLPCFLLGEGDSCAILRRRFGEIPISAAALLENLCTELLFLSTLGFFTRGEVVTALGQIDQLEQRI